MWTTECSGSVHISFSTVLKPPHTGLAWTPHRTIIPLYYPCGTVATCTPSFSSQSVQDKVPDGEYRRIVMGKVEVGTYLHSMVSRATSQLSRTTTSSSLRKPYKHHISPAHRENNLSENPRARFRGVVQRLTLRIASTSSPPTAPRASAASCRTILCSPGSSSTLRRDATEAGFCICPIT